MSNDLTHTSADIAIIGGGIAGLWLLNRLCNQGYNAVLFESNSLGGEQTIASQGMIHGGIKYALGGALTGASEAIADMPDHWRRCLKGEGDVDLRNARVLSEHFYMWSTKSLTSRITSFFASKVTRGRVNTVETRDRPAAFASPQFKGHLYQLVDLVLDAPSVVKTLADNYQQRIFRIDWQRSRFIKDASGKVKQLLINDQVALSAQQFILCAGAGNEWLCEQLGINKPRMQRRPLKQVLVKHHYPYALYAHCMGGNPSPRLTVSSHQREDGAMVWYLGGDLATEGVALSDGALIEKAKQELDQLFPWLDFSNAEFATLSIDRAEPKQKALVKPDKAFAAWADNCSNVIVAWPTKLTLAPNMANEVNRLLQQQAVVPSAKGDPSALRVLPKPDIGTPCWESLFNEPTEQ